MKQIMPWAFVSLGLAASMLILFTFAVKILPSFFILITVALCLGVVIVGVRLLRSNGQTPRVKPALVSVLAVIILMAFLFVSGGIFYFVMHSMH